MYIYHNTLKNHDDNNYPLSMEYQKESRYSHCHSVSDRNGFSVCLSGSKHLFITPDIKTFSFKINANVKDSIGTFGTVDFGVLFGYDPFQKTGYLLEISYGIEHTAVISCAEISNVEKNILNKSERFSVDWENLSDISIEFSVNDDKCYGNVGGCYFDFPCTPKEGRLGLMVSAVFEKIVFSDVEITTDEEPARKLISTQNIDVANPNGGMLPYQIKLQLFGYSNGIYAVEYMMSGGISSLQQLSKAADAWVYQYDDITNPYIKFIIDGYPKKCYLYNGVARFMDPRFETEIRDVYERIMLVKDTPLTGVIYLTDDCENAIWGFGYDDFYSAGTQSMTGAQEYLFDSAKQVVYQGEPLEKELVSTLISLDKKIVNDIPQSLYQYEDAVYHAINNHYFYVDETPKFSLKCYTKFKPEFLNCTVKLLDAFFEEICSIESDSLKKIEDNNIGQYNKVNFDFSLPCLKCGVYHVSVDISYGNKQVHNHCSAFEIIDPLLKISPQEASQLPIFYYGDGGPIGIESTLPDFYSKRVEHDWGHYVSIAHYMPAIAQKKQVWEILKLYKRKLFTWMTRRTTRTEDIPKLRDVIENTDYINYPYPAIENTPYYYRFDLFAYDSYSDFLLNVLNKFLDKHPQYRCALGIDDATKKFEENDLTRLLKFCGSEWIQYALIEIQKIFFEQNEELKDINPQIKRSSYGPWSAYAAPLGSGYMTKWFGFEPNQLDKIFDGFLQFEDYPFSAAYATTRGTWGLMTAKLLCPNVSIFPELYMDFPAGCPDHAVCTAYPPFGKSICPNYFTATQIAGYVYDTAYYKNGRFDYWNDYGFSLFMWLNRPKERAYSILSFWGKFIQNKPVIPCRTTAFLFEISPQEDRYDYDKVKNHFYNISESNMGYLFGLMKTSGFTSGFVTTYADVLNLNSDVLNSIVLPDLSNASENVIQKIRLLHSQGITLIAVGKVPGLEDLFGVKQQFTSAVVNSLSDNIRLEKITPFTSEFSYAATDGRVELYANELPVIISGNNTVLFNTCASQVGIDSVWQFYSQGRPNISVLLKETFVRVLDDKLSSVARCSDESGITIVKTESGDNLMVITDYSEYDQSKLDTKRFSEVVFSDKRWKDALYIPVENHNPDIYKVYQDNRLAEMRVQLRPQETLMFKLIAE